MEEPKYPLFRSNTITLWGQLADHLQYRLDRLEFKYELPAFSKFAIEYGVTSSTVSRAIGELQQQGLVVSLPDRRGLCPTGREYKWGVTRYHWRSVAWEIYQKCPELLEEYSFGAPRYWRHGFQADIWRHQGNKPDQNGVN